MAAERTRRYRARASSNVLIRGPMPRISQVKEHQYTCLFEADIWRTSEASSVDSVEGRAGFLAEA